MWRDNKPSNYGRWSVSAQEDRQKGNFKCVRRAGEKFRQIGWLEKACVRIHADTSKILRTRR